MKIFSIIATVSIGVVVYVFTLLIRNTVLPRIPIVETPQSLGMDYQEVSFLSGDGSRLKGWLILRDPEAPTIILCHGLGTNRSDPLIFAKMLYDAGDWNLLLFDFGGHGESERKVTSFGYLEQRDLAGAVQYLDGRQDLRNHHYGAFGISMGGAVAILEGARNPRLEAIAVDSCYVTLSEAMVRYMRLLYHLPEQPFGWISSLAWQARFLTPIRTVSPLDRIAQISPRPVLLFHGEADERIPVSDALRLYERAGQPKEIWAVPNAGHLGSYSAAPEEYQEKLLDFFRRNLPLNAASTAS